MLMRSRVAIVALLALMLSCATLAQDTVTLKDNSTKAGLISDIDFRAVKMTVTGGGGSTTIKADDYTYIQFGALPKEYKQADDELGRGKFDDAASAFQTVLDNKKIRGPLRQEAWMKQAECFVRLDKADDAIKSLKGLLEEFPQSRYLERAESTVADILMRTGKAADAVTYLEGEEARVGKISESTAIVERVKLNKAKASLAAGDSKKAKAEATTIASGTGAAAGGAKVLLAQVALVDKAVPEAKRLFQEALKSVSAKQDRAGCFNGLGAILLEEGKNDRKPEPLRDAQLLFLRTALVEMPEAGEPTDAHEAGIYNAGVCFQLLGELGAPAAPAGAKGAESKAGEAKGDESQARNLQRARELFRRLLREYPQSKYASEAQTRLQKLGG